VQASPSIPSSSPLSLPAPLPGYTLWASIARPQRRAKLAEQGRAGAPYRSVLTITVAGFALADYEWILPLEADHLSDLVGRMRDLRSTEGRRHVREKTPSCTGRRITPEQILEVVR